MSDQAYRTAFLDPDYRRDATTELHCIRCQRPLTSGKHRWAHIVDGGCNVLHPEDESIYVSDSGDMLFHPIGNDCAKQVGLAFTIPDV